MSTVMIVVSWWVQEFLDRPRRKHLTTDPSCVEHRAPRPGSWIDRASRGLECEPCMIRRAFAAPAVCDRFSDDKGGEGCGLPTCGCHTRGDDHV